MAKPKTSRQDLHKSGHLIRLPAEYHDRLKELARVNRRPMTVELQIALDKHLPAKK